MFHFYNPASLLQQTLQILSWNRRILKSLPPVPEQVKKTAPDADLYLRGRNRVFNDFAEAAEKLAAAIQRSGFLLLFQLSTEVAYLRSLTVKEVEELLDYLPRLFKRFPEVEDTYVGLLATLKRISTESQ